MTAVQEKSDGYLGNQNLKKANVPVEWTPELIEEYLKCRDNPIYFIENYMRIVHVDDGLIHFKPRDYQKRLIESMTKDRFVLAVMSRQVGKSTAYIGFLTHYILFNEHKQVGILANKGETARELLGRIKLAYQYLPKWLQQGVTEWNKGNIVLENGCEIFAGATSSNAVRGYSFSVLVLDECVTGDSEVTVRNKKTGEVYSIPIGELYEKYK